MHRLSLGFPKKVRLASLLAALSVVLLVAVACGDGATTDTSGATETSAPAGALAEPVTSLADTTTSPDAAETSTIADGVDTGLVGKWYSEQTGETHEYTADGRLIVTSGGGAVTQMNYTADGSNISYIIGGAVVYTGTYSVDGDTLSQVDPDIAGTVFFSRL